MVSTGSTSGKGVYSDSGLFLCFEGGEGGGKSTQAKLLADWLGGDREVLLTHEPGATEVGQKIRQVVLGTETGHLDDRTEALLYAADKSEHLDKVVRPALERDAIVVTDRYVDSSLAYQGAGRALDTAELEWVLRWATGDLRPHLTVLLDVDPTAGLTRFTDRDRIEGEPLEFHQRVRQAFLDLAAADQEHYLVIDAGGSVDEVFATIRDRVAGLLP